MRATKAFFSIVQIKSLLLLNLAVNIETDNTSKSHPKFEHSITSFLPTLTYDYFCVRSCDVMLSRDANLNRGLSVKEYSLRYLVLSSVLEHRVSLRRI